MNKKLLIVWNIQTGEFKCHNICDFTSAELEILPQELEKFIDDLFE